MLLADENMSCLDSLFRPLGPLETMPGRAIQPGVANHELLASAEALLVRSVTPVNRALLDAMPRLRFVGTATIGTDHLDTAALDDKGIAWTNAPGCNANAVGEYVFSAILTLAKRTGVAPRGRTYGLIGLGNTGQAVAQRLEALGVEVLRCDPIKEAQGLPGPWVSLETLLERSDVISCHVPRTTQGPNATHHLLNHARLSALQPGTWLINASRGEVVDNQALVAVKAVRPDLRLVLDVWEGEPKPMVELVDLADIATPHIAGYSVEGKIRGSLVLYRALLGEGTVVPEMASLIPQPAPELYRVDGALDWQGLAELCCHVYDLEKEDILFRAALAEPGGFDRRRKANLARREFSAQRVAIAPGAGRDLLNQLGFQTER